MATYTVDIGDSTSLDDLIAAYRNAGGVVETPTTDSASNSSTSTSTETSTTTYPLFTYNLPDISYTPQSLSDLLTEAGNLYNGGYERQQQAAQREHDNALIDTSKQYQQSRDTLLNAATARGFGRSSYVTDALTKTNNEENYAKERYSSALSQTLSNLNAERESQIAAYASSKKAEQEAKLLELEMFRAELELQLKKAAYEAEVTKFNYDQQNSTSSSGSSGGYSGYSSGYGSSGSTTSGSSSSSSSSKNSTSSNGTTVTGTMNSGYVRSLDPVEQVRQYGADLYTQIATDNSMSASQQKAVADMAKAIEEGYKNASKTNTVYTTQPYVSAWDKAQAAKKQTAAGGGSSSSSGSGRTTTTKKTTTQKNRGTTVR